jgi:hypothetical protein
MQFGPDLLEEVAGVDTDVLTGGEQTGAQLLPETGRSGPELLEPRP